jgi:thioredoxin-like negative regulator of GroEL
MEREVWSNADIISMVETGFIPVKLNAERDAGFVAAQQIRAFPTTLLFTQDARLITSATGYMPPNQLAGLLRSAQRPQSASERVTQYQ